MTRAGLIILAFVSSSLVAYIGCDSSAVTNLSKDNIFDQLAAARCEAAASCCGSSASTANPQCATELAADLRTMYEPIGANPYIVLDPARAELCLSRVRALRYECEASLMRDAGTDICSQMFNGTLAPGARCELSIECQTTESHPFARCDYIAGDDLNKHCTRWTRSGLGAPCSLEMPAGPPYEQGGCEPSTTVCDPVSMTCVSLGNTGEPCAHSTPACLSGLACVPSDGTSGSEPVCSARRRLGESCTPVDCALPWQCNPCVELAYCDEASSSCQKALRPGQACSTGVSCRTGVCEGGVCVTDSLNLDTTVEDVPHACQ